MFFSHRHVALCLCALAPLAGCGESPPSPEVDAAVGIGPGGGTIFGDGVTLTVPPGALTVSTPITITREEGSVPAGYVGYSPVWRFAPSGLTFAVPATVQMTFTGDAARAGLYWSATTGYERLAATVSGGTIVGPVTHFSEGFVGAPLATDGGAPDVPAALNVGLDVPTLPDGGLDVPAMFDVGTADATTDAGLDVGVDVPVDVPVDVSVDVSVDVPVAPDVSIDAGPSTAPRPLSPPSSATVSTRRPALRWALAAGTDGAHVDLCRDRALTTGCVTFDATGGTVTPSADLALGAWFWRLRGRAGGVTGSAASATWTFRVGARAALVAGAPLPGFDANGDGRDDLAVGDPSSNAVYVYAGGATGLAATPAATLAGLMGEQFGAVVGAAGDVNGDGYGDLLVRAAGAVRVFLSGSAGLAVTPAQSLGAAVASFSAAGDLDGDGYGDVLLGAGSTATVYYGSAGGLVTRTGGPTCAVTGGCGALVAGAGDVDGDGYADALLGSGGRLQLHLGSAAGLVAVASRTFTDGSGGSFDGAGALGDVDGDGYADVFAATTASPGVLIYQGAAAGPSVVPTTNYARSGAGYLPGRAGDVNGDGYDDLVMEMGGGVRVIPGSATGLRTLPLSTSSVANSTAVTLGDYDGDGYADVAANSAYDTNAATIFPGSASGAASAASLTLSDPEVTVSPAAVPALASWPLGGGPAGGFYVTPSSVWSCLFHFPYSCTLWPHALGARVRAAAAYAADLDADGQDDVLLGAPGSNSAHVVTTEGDDGVVRATVTGPAGSAFGSSVAVADVNHDGVNDAVVGAPDGARAYVYLGGAGFPHAPVVLAGAAGCTTVDFVANAGDLNGDSFDDVAVASDDRVDVFPGSAAGATTTAALSLTGAAGARFGYAVASAGDVNHDGLGDLAVGAPGANAVYVYYGRAAFPVATASVTLTGVAGSEFGSAVINPGATVYNATVNSLMVGAPGANAAFVYAGSATGLGTTPTQTLGGTAGTRFGATLGRAYTTPANRTNTVVPLAVGATNGATFPVTFYLQSCGSRGPCTLTPDSHTLWNVPRPPTFRSSFGIAVASH